MVKTDRMAQAEIENADTYVNHVLTEEDIMKNIEGMNKKAVLRATKTDAVMIEAACAAAEEAEIVEDLTLAGFS